MDLMDKSNDDGGTLASELAEVCRKLASMGALDAESRARRILSDFPSRLTCRKSPRRNFREDGGCALRLRARCL